MLLLLLMLAADASCCCCSMCSSPTQCTVCICSNIYTSIIQLTAIYKTVELINHDKRRLLCNTSSQNPYTFAYIIMHKYTCTNAPWLWCTVYAKLTLGLMDEFNRWEIDNTRLVDRFNLLNERKEKQLVTTVTQFFVSTVTQYWFWLWRNFSFGCGAILVSVVTQF